MMGEGKTYAAGISRKYRYPVDSQVGTFSLIGDPLRRATEEMSSEA